MSKKIFSIIIVALFALVLPFTAQSEGIPLQKDILLSTPIFGPEDLPEEITFTLYDSQTATTPLGYQTFQRGQYTVDFEFSKSNGITSGNVARISVAFTKTLNLTDAEGESIRPKEIWVAFKVGGTEISDRSKVSDETLVQLLLASDASIATYLTLAYTGDDNPIKSIYKDLPIETLSSDGSGFSLKNYFSAVAAGVSEETIAPNSTTSPYWEFLSNNVFYNTGNVGIGTTSPSESMHVYKAGTGTARLLFETGGAGAPSLVFKNSLNQVDWYLSSTTGNFSYYDGGDKFTIDTSGNVGIGIAIPTELLHVYKAGTGTARLLFETGGAGAPSLVFKNSLNQVEWYLSSTTGNFSYYDGGDKFTIDTSGNVGIGTTNPGTHKLAVEGTIGCRELTVTTAAWADFVFKDSYNLIPLNEVEQFISENKHLPGIPTESEVKNRGISLGSISSKLLQKIEELTLYVIALKKENDILKAQMTSIQEQLQSPMTER
jgi:hypothetical protein